MLNAKSNLNWMKHDLQPLSPTITHQIAMPWGISTDHIITRYAYDVMGRLDRQMVTLNSI